MLKTKQPTTKALNKQLKAHKVTTHITLDSLVESLHLAVANFPDARTGKNTQYEVADAAGGAFSTFYTQSRSFLEHQRSMELQYGKNNARTLFQINDIPSDNQIRKLLDPVDPNLLSPVFDDCFKLLKANGQLDDYRVIFNPGEKPNLLTAFDGLHYFSSGKLSCKNCLLKHSRGKSKTDDDEKEIVYYHSMVTPVIVAPDHDKVIPLMPEFVKPQDGSKKQDCELNASKRWIKTHSAYQKEDITVLGDDLYAHEPFCKETVAAGYHFIFVAKPESHKELYAKAHKPGVTTQKITTSQKGNKTLNSSCSYANGLPLHAGKDALTVNFVEVTITDLGSGKQTYHNAFVTDHPITDDNVELIAASGRSRWKIENENNNTLKTKGYHLDHNFGHGKKNLSSVLATMNILAFAFHTVQDFCNDKYITLRAMIGSRKKFFEHMKILLIYNCFDDFDDMLDWMIQGLKKKHKPESRQPT